MISYILRIGNTQTTKLIHFKNQFCGGMETLSPLQIHSDVPFISHFNVTIFNTCHHNTGNVMFH